MFFDLGCKTAVFREGVPGKELREKVTRKGPFTMLGVGDIRTQANDQWLCVLDTADGGEQFVESLSVNKVTTDFPLINSFCHGGRRSLYNMGVGGVNLTRTF